MSGGRWLFGLAAVIGLLLAIGLGLLLGSGGAPSASSPAPSTPAPSLEPSPSIPAPSPSPIASVTTPPTAPPPPPPTAAPTPPPTPRPTPRPARIRSFEGPATVDCNDPDFQGTIRLTWEVVRATSVSLSIDGPGIFMRYDDLTGGAVVPFSCGEPFHTYLLKTIGGVGEPDTAELVITRAG